LHLEEQRASEREAPTWFCAFHQVSASSVIIAALVVALVIVGNKKNNLQEFWFLVARGF
jgi:hypothetical protein